MLKAQETDQPWLAAQARLNEAYDTFVKVHGPINETAVSERLHAASGETREYYRYPNVAPFRDDPDCWLVASIEHYDANTRRASKGPIFTGRVVACAPQMEIRSAHDALAVVLNECGKVDIQRIAELIGKPPEETIADLGKVIYLDPATKSWETADAYLSGMVRDKLTAARAAAVLDKQFERNVEALEGAQPDDLPPSEITARLGAPWVPATDIQLFTKDTIGVDAGIYHTPEIGQWSVTMPPFTVSAAASTDWGTPRRHAGLLLLDALSSSVPQIFDKIKDANGDEKRVLNERATEAAKEKLVAIKQAFADWVWTDPDRTDRLAKTTPPINNLVPRSFNGDHLVLPGASDIIALRRHQKRSVWRIICSGAAYLSHVVGAGKTFAAIAAVMNSGDSALSPSP